MFKDLIWKSLPFVEFPLFKDTIPVWRSNLNGFLTVTIARSFIHMPWIKPPCNWMSLTLCTPYFLSSFCHAFAVLAGGRLFLICPVIIKYLKKKTCKGISINNDCLFCHFLSQLILKTQSNRLYTHILFPFTLPRTHWISGLKSQVLKPTFLTVKWWWKVV